MLDCDAATEECSEQKSITAHQGAERTHGFGVSVLLVDWLVAGLGQMQDIIN